MLICRKCKAPINNGVCSSCGRNKNFIEASCDDEVYLTTAEFLFSRVVDDILTEGNIPFAKKTSMGSGITVYIGELNEEYKYYVKASDYEKAKELLPCNVEFEDDEFQ